MKVSRNNSNAGSAVIVIMVLLSIMLIYIGANLKALHSLKRELKLIEQRQVQRVHGRGAAQAQSATNLPPQTVTPPSAVPQVNEP